MNGIIIQQLSINELESLMQTIIREELSRIKFPDTSLKPPESPGHDLLTKCQAAKFLAISIPTFTKMVKERKVIAYKVGNRYKFKKSQILLTINSK